MTIEPGAGPAQRVEPKQWKAIHVASLLVITFPVAVPLLLIGTGLNGWWPLAIVGLLFIVALNSDRIAIGPLKGKGLRWTLVILALFSQFTPIINVVRQAELENDARRLLVSLTPIGRSWQHEHPFFHRFDDLPFADETQLANA